VDFAGFLDENWPDDLHPLPRSREQFAARDDEVTGRKRRELF
jgi:hypothetical protein